MHWCAVLIGALALTGCSSPTAAPGATASSFADAWKSGNGAEVCRLLAPATRSEVAQSAQRPCRVAVLGEQLPSPGGEQAVDAWGRAAQVAMQHDTFFLSRFAVGWRVVAAGCKRQPGQPYDCAIEGG